MQQQYQTSQVIAEDYQNEDEQMQERSLTISNFDESGFQQKMNNINQGFLEERKFNMQDLMNETNYNNLAESRIYNEEYSVFDPCALHVNPGQ